MNKDNCVFCSNKSDVKILAVRLSTGGYYIGSFCNLCLLTQSHDNNLDILTPNLKISSFFLTGKSLRKIIFKEG